MLHNPSYLKQTKVCGCSNKGHISSFLLVPAFSCSKHELKVMPHCASTRVEFRKHLIMQWQKVVDDICRDFSYCRQEGDSLWMVQLDLSAFLNIVMIMTMSEYLILFPMCGCEFDNVALPCQVIELQQGFGIFPLAFYQVVASLDWIAKNVAVLRIMLCIILRTKLCHRSNPQNLIIPWRTEVKYCQVNCACSLQSLLYLIHNKEMKSKSHVFTFDISVSGF